MIISVWQITLPRSSWTIQGRWSEYISSDNPIEQSGFHGGRVRWVQERSPLIEAINGDGDFLDVGCANGLLAEDVMGWTAERGYRVVPYGVDIGEELIELARQRLPEAAPNFVVADAWVWKPARTWTYVFSLLDLAPEDLRCQWLASLCALVAPGGRLIVGAYGSVSQGVQPEDPTISLAECGYRVLDSSSGGEPINSRFAWTTNAIRS